MKKSRAKYPVDSIIKHKKYGYICKIIYRDSHEVILSVIKGDKVENTLKNAHYEDEGGLRLYYSPNSINLIFEDLGPSAKILYGKD